MDQEALKQTIERLKQAQNVLVTVSSNPSVDQLAACIGFTLFLNKLGKHGTAVFSGKIPSTLEFLKPEETIEPNTDSLRDFIIALDKSKADKLRYKVEDQVVKIFITPYRTSINEEDLDFSQGDFNVDAVVAIGVQERTDLDQAIVAHGRILHDATIISVNNKEQGNIGTINWVNLGASSLSEMLVELSKSLSPEPLDPQMATALMTGIVAETERFSNGKTNPRTMSIAAELMSAGANQQLIAAKLEEPQPEEANTKPATSDAKDAKDEKADDEPGSLRIVHDDDDEEDEDEEKEASSSLPPVVEDAKQDEPPVATTEENAPASPSMVSNRSLLNTKTPPAYDADQTATPARGPDRPAMVTEPPALGAKLTANTKPEELEASVDPLSNNAGPAFQPILRRPAPVQPKIDPTETLANLEKSLDTEVTTDQPQPVASPTTNPSPAMPPAPVAEQAPPAVDPAAQVGPEAIETARTAVDNAIAYSDPADNQFQPPVQSLGSQPINQEPINAPAANPMSAPPASDEAAVNPNNLNIANPDIPSSLLPKDQPVDSTFGTTTSPSAPPPVPPPMLVPNSDKPGF